MDILFDQLYCDITEGYVYVGSVMIVTEFYCESVEIQ